MNEVLGKAIIFSIWFQYENIVGSYLVDMQEEQLLTTSWKLFIWWEL